MLKRMKHESTFFYVEGVANGNSGVIIIIMKINM